MKRYIAVLFLPLLFSIAGEAFAQELVNETQGTWRARVAEVIDQEIREIPGTDTEHLYQSIRAELLEGPREGEIILIENDYLELREGDAFFLDYLVTVDGDEIYVVRDVDRRFTLLVLALVFAGAVVAFGGYQGVRSLIALLGSFLAIFYILIPGLLSGWNPFIASFFVAAGVLFAAIFFTHGFNRQSAVAYAGTMIAVVLTTLFSVVAVRAAKLSGFSSDESIYLNFNTGGELDFVGLLLGAIVIGILGILDDIAVTQAAVVGELKDAAPNLSRRELYAKAIRVGREHVGALVNTLVLAYTGAALPLLLLFRMSESGFSSLVNMEIFATEIVRTIAGSVGLIMTVPIVTALAVWIVRPGGSHSHHHHR